MFISLQRETKKYLLTFLVFLVGLNTVGCKFTSEDEVENILSTDYTVFTYRMSDINSPYARLGSDMLIITNGDIEWYSNGSNIYEIESETAIIESDVEILQAVATKLDLYYITEKAIYRYSIDDEVTSTISTDVNPIMLYKKEDFIIVVEKDGNDFKSYSIDKDDSMNIVDLEVPFGDTLYDNGNSYVISPNEISINAQNYNFVDITQQKNCEGALSAWHSNVINNCVVVLLQYKDDSDMVDLNPKKSRGDAVYIISVRGDYSLCYETQGDERIVAVDESNTYIVSNRELVKYSYVDKSRESILALDENKYYFFESLAGKLYCFQGDSRFDINYENTITLE